MSSWQRQAGEVNEQESSGHDAAGTRPAGGGQEGTEEGDQQRIESIDASGKAAAARAEGVMGPDRDPRSAWPAVASEEIRRAEREKIIGVLPKITFSSAGEYSGFVHSG